MCYNRIVLGGSDYMRSILARFMPFTNLLLSERTLYSFDRKKLANQR